MLVLDFSFEFFLTSVVILTKKFNSDETLREVDTDRPIKALSIVFLPRTAKNEANRTTNDPMISNLMPSQRLAMIFR